MGCGLTDKQFNRERLRLDALRNKWMPILGLTDSAGWDMTLIYHRESSIDEGRSEKHALVNSDAGYAWACLGKASVLWQYKRATLRFDVREMEGHSDAFAESVFVHECCHVLVAQMREWCQTDKLEDERATAALKHEEHVVVGLAKAFIKAHGAGSKSGYAEAYKSAARKPAKKKKVGRG